MEDTSSVEKVTDGEEQATPVMIDKDLLPKPLKILQIKPTDVDEICTFYILGTAHVSKASCDDTAKLIQTIQPDLIMVELCPERQSILTMKDLQEPSISEVISQIRSGKSTPFQAIYSWLLARVGTNLEVLPGEEFRVAVREAQSINAGVVLGDRPLSMTLARVWAALSTWEKWKLSAHLLWTGINLLDTDQMKKEIEGMKESDALTEAIREFGKEFPSLIQPLLTERDKYMAHVLRCLSPKARIVVAVVGAGHLEGIEKHWDKDIDVAAICSIPVEKKSTPWGRYVMLFAVSGMAYLAVSRWRHR